MKTFFLSFIAFGCCMGLFGHCFLRQSQMNILMKEIYLSYKENKELDEKILKQITFEPVKKQPELEGTTLKVVFKGSDGNRWLFKPQIWRREVTGAIYQLALLYGIDTPEVHEVMLPFDGFYSAGAVQRWVTSRRTLDEVGPRHLTKKEIAQIQRHQVFDWIILNQDNPGGSFLETTEGAIFAIDKDDSFPQNFIKEQDLLFTFNKVEQEYYCSLWEDYRRKNLNVDLTEIFPMIDYISEVDDEILRDVFSFFPQEDMNRFILRKQKLREDFSSYYEHLANARGETFIPPPKNKDRIRQYSLIVLGKMRKEIERKKAVLRGLIKTKFKAENDLEGVIPLPYFLVRFASGEEINNYLKQLDTLRNITPAIFKKLLISLSIRQIEEEASFIQRMKQFDIWTFLEMATDLETVNMSAGGRPPKGHIPPDSNTLNIDELEYYLRRCYKKKIEDRKSIYDTFSQYKIAISNNPYDILTSQMYSWIGLIVLNEFGPMITEWKEQMDGYPDANPLKVNLNLIYIDQEGIGRMAPILKKINDKMIGGHLFLAMFYRSLHMKNELVNEIEMLRSGGKNKIEFYGGSMMLADYCEYNSEGIRFGRGSDIDQAVTYYKQSIDINPNRLKPYLNLSVLYIIKRMPESVLDTLIKAAAVDPDWARENFHIQDKSAYNQGPIETLRMNTLSGEDHYILGLANILKREYQLAQKHFDKARELGYLSKEIYNEARQFK